MFGRILTVMTGTEKDHGAANASVALAERLGADVRGLLITSGPDEIARSVGIGANAAMFSGDVINDMIEANKKHDKARAEEARAVLEAAARAVNLQSTQQNSDGLHPNSSVQVIQGPLSLEVVQGPELDIFDSAARLSNLVVFSQPGGSQEFGVEKKIEHALLSLRRPVLLAPADSSSKIGEKIVVAFDGSAESCNALLHSVPILKNSKSVEVLQINEQGRTPKMGDQAISYLELFGIEADLTQREPSGQNVGEDIDNYVASVGADLLVMGGYGHAKVLELMLGGATRHMLYHSSIPVYLCH